ncbi:MAG TPA: KpsF/GutQ family sugar-phosphate isomerase [Candidatus Binatia bacterium]|nr:KpsF/GutQ family sugar-phosphate isomerase [Candidatus Binatia bacterium]
MSNPRAGADAQRRMKEIAKNVIRIEADALRALAERLAGPMGKRFEGAVELLYGCAGRVVVTGMGKSGLIARKIAATLTSTGSPALFLHPAEALHGDLGMVVRGDVVLALSASGETGEILQLLATIKRLGIPVISMTCDELHAMAEEPRTLSTLAQAADVALDCSVAHEACSLGLAPTASTTTMLALGDALAVALSERRGFREEDFAHLHPGGKLGKRFARVSSLMHGGAAIPMVEPGTPMGKVIYEMSRKGLGMTTVVEGGRLVGLISDGDLRRLLERHGKEVLDLTAAQCMTRSPKVVDPEMFAIAALDIMEQKKITALPVVDAEGRLRGVLHLHDLWETEML